jgi:hypothetical protein
MKKIVKAEVFGYPKIDVNRELKKVLESFFGPGKSVEMIFERD